MRKWLTLTLIAALFCAALSLNGLAESGQPFDQVSTVEEFRDCLIWMYENRQTHLELSKMYLPWETCSEAIDRVGFLKAGTATWYGDQGPVSIDVEFSYAVRLVFAMTGGDMNALSAEDRQVAAMAQQALQEIIHPGMTDIEKELAIHDFIIFRTRYLIDLEGHCTGDPRGVFLYGTAQCEGYAQTFLMLGLLAGLEVYPIGGFADNSQSTGTHTWTLIRLDGLWYAVDPTWDDTEDGTGLPDHFYFNIPLCYIAGAHVWYEDYLPAGDYARLLDENYYYKYVGCYAGEQDEALEKIEQQAQSSGTALVCYFDGRLDDAALSDALLNRLGGYSYTRWRAETLVLDYYEFTGF